MNIRNLLLFLSAASLMMSSCAGLDGLLSEPKARVESVDLTEVSFDAVTLTVKVEIDNPNPLGLSLKAYDYSLRAWDSTLADGRQEHRVSIRPDGISTLPIPITLKFADLVNVGTEARSADSVPLDIALGLEIDMSYLGALRLDLNAAAEVPVPKPPIVVPGNLRVDRLGLGGAGLTFELEVRNPNSFAMDIRSLEGRLIVGDRAWGALQLKTPLTLSGNSRKAVDFGLEVDFGQVGRSAWSLLSGSGSTRVRLDGSMNVSPDLPGFRGSDLNWDADARVSIVR